MFCLFPFVLKAQTGEVSITQANNGSNIDVSVFLKRTGGTAWNLGEASFVFNLNNSAINNSGAALQTKGMWDAVSNGNYGSMFTANYGGVARSVEVTLNTNPGADVPVTSTLVGMIRLPITNPNANHNITWHTTFTAVITDIGDDVALTFVNPENALLPVELSSFSSIINKNTVELKWSTASEQNNKGFSIERKKDGGEYTEAGFVKGAGNSSETKDYSFRESNLQSGKYNYRLKQTDFNGNLKYYELTNEVIIDVPKSFAVSQNYPNPFNPSTKINFEIPKDGLVNLKVYDVSGREVRTLVNEVKQAGYYTADFNAAGLSSGIYFYSISAAGFNQTKKMVLVK